MPRSCNHSVEFVDRQTGVHTQNIESYWNRTKIKQKRMRGCHKSHLVSYLDEFMWREGMALELIHYHNFIFLLYSLCKS